MLRRIAEGDMAAYKDIYNLYRHKLYSYLLHLTRSHEMTEDVVQDVFLKIWEDRKKLAQVDHFNAYFQVMIKNRSFNLLKRMAMEAGILEDIKMIDQAGVAKEGDQIVYNELQRKLSRLVSELPEQQRIVYHMSREQGMKPDEIASQLNISVNTVKTHLSRGLNYLRKSLEGDLLLGLLICLIIKQ